MHFYGYINSRKIGYKTNKFHITARKLHTPLVHSLSHFEMSNTFFLQEPSTPSFLSADDLISYFTEIMQVMKKNFYRLTFSHLYSHNPPSHL